MDIEKREQLREGLDRWFEVPLAVAAVALIGLLLVDLVHDPAPPWDQYIEWTGLVIWGLFVVEFGIRVMLSSDRSRYLRAHWLDALAVALPPLRILRGLRAVQVLVYGSRGASELMERLRRRRLGKLAVVTLFVGLSGAALLYIAEAGHPQTPIRSFGDAIYWTTVAVISGEGGLGLASIGGRVVELLMVVYSVVIFSYLVGAVASLWIESDRLDQIVQQSVAEPGPGNEQVDRGA